MLHLQVASVFNIYVEVTVFPFCGDGCEVLDNCTRSSCVYNHLSTSLVIILFFGKCSIRLESSPKTIIIFSTRYVSHA